MNELHNYGLARFSKRTGKIDTVMVGLGQGLIKLWALQNTLETKACVVVDIDERKVVFETVGIDGGFPKIHDKPEAFEYDLPEGIFDVFDDEVYKREVERKRRKGE